MSVQKATETEKLLDSIREMGIELNDDFEISLDKNAALTVQLGISGQANAVFDLGSLF